MNPVTLLKMKDRLNIFRTEHPKVSPFFHKVKEHGLTPGSVIELKVTTPDGKEHVTNIRVTPNDIETINMLSRQKEDKTQ